MDDTNRVLTNFSELLTRLARDSGCFSISLPSDWQQGRTAYGGLLAALGLHATQQAFADLPPLRSAQFIFFAPATGALRLTPSVLRRGKSAVFVGVDIESEAGVCARAHFCFGLARDIDQDFLDVPWPAASPAQACPELFTWPNQPQFRQHFEGRLVRGGRPGNPSSRPEMLVWMRHRDKHVAADYVGLLALADALSPAAFAMYQHAVPLSTMTWEIDFLPADCPVSSDGWWLLQCAADYVRHGYSTQGTTIWNSAGRPVLIARQTIALFNKTS
ncbi:thioesterase family protein [Cupriavidus numazuensis]|uniref:Acyl-CoA thioesterase II n=1 Tax=Cupriavidus numazuensis TaxID=221992 RepID=A0ABM8TQL5_9BURK|nr:thioesterase family protein [Cupriavidus numazuensis]CAG2158250.1 hypothetical protein LMG26411_05903 [Cupriavidus numazuensis]